MNRKIILIRHGQSTYNLENRFTGWKDVELTEKGRDEAINAGKILNENNLIPDYAFTSNLKRAQHTLDIILNEMNLTLPTTKDLALNERDYGDLIGQNKAEAALEFGDEQVQIWRRSYDVPPPGGESLKMTCERVHPYLENAVMQKLNDYKTIIVAAHGNSIRAIVMKLFDYTPEEILKTEIGWCEPWVFTFNEDLTVKDFEIIGINQDESNSFVPREVDFSVE